MTFKVIKGTLHIVGYSPDGDSIRFKADKPERWQQLQGKSVRLNSKQHAQLRIESIDTLETHYRGMHQPVKCADLATERLFNEVGIYDVRWNEARSKVLSAADGVAAYVVSRRTDKYGRPISFLFPQELEFQDGSDLFVNKTNIKRSLNYAMLKAGLAYPTFYDGLFYDLREVFSKAAQSARQRKAGVWALDKTNVYSAIIQLSDITDELVLLPKFFRRILAFMQQQGGFEAQGFLDYLRQEEEKVFILNRLHFTYLHNIVRANSQGKIKLSELPEDLVFLT